MKCRDCNYCEKGWFESKPYLYVCTGVKHPFAISNIDNECTEYVYKREQKFQTEETFDRQTALRVLQDLSKNMYPNYDIFGHKTLVINRERFEEVRKKYLDKKE